MKKTALFAALMLLGSGAYADGGLEAEFQAHCNLCHGTGAAGAPKVGDKAAWEPRLAKGMPTLLDHIHNGFNAMPPKGMCDECTDDDFKKLIEKMSK